MTNQLPKRKLNSNMKSRLDTTSISQTTVVVIINQTVPSRSYKSHMFSRPIISESDRSELPVSLSVIISLTQGVYHVL